VAFHYSSCHLPGYHRIEQWLSTFHRTPAAPKWFSHCKPKISPSSMSFGCVCVGSVTKTFALSEVLPEAMAYVDGDTSNHGNLPNHISSLPSLLLLMCREEMEPLTSNAHVMALVCRVANLPVKNACPAILMKLLAVQDFQTLDERKATICELVDTDVFTSKACAVQRKVNTLKDSLDLVA